MLLWPCPLGMLLFQLLFEAASPLERGLFMPIPSAFLVDSQIYEKSPDKVKNYGIWFRYESRTGTHNA